MMNVFTFLFVSVVCLMGGMAMPTDLDRGAVTTVTSGQSEESCVWRSDIPEQNMTDLRETLDAVKTRASNAFNSTCRDLIADPEDYCPILKDLASKADGYPSFDPRVTNSCDVQEVLRQATQVISESSHLIGQFSNDVRNQTRGSDLDSLKNRLEYAGRQLGAMIGDSVLPTAVVTIARDGDITSINQRNVRIPARVELEAGKIMTAIDCIISHI